MFNKYSHINNLTSLRKPRKRVIPQASDLANFLTSNTDLKKMANFGLEMMKWLPLFEQKVYDGSMSAREGEGVAMRHGDKTSWVGQEWWDAFNEYSIDAGAYDVNGNGSIEANERITDQNGDGRITNADTIIWAQNQDWAEDGLTEWRTGWVAGQHHRVGSFGPFGSQDDSGFAGGGMGAQFKNVDFIAEASEWNHIGRKNDPGAKGYDATVEDQAYFANDILAALGKSWGDVKALLEGTRFAGQSFYQIVMNRSYQSLTAEEGFLLIAGMYESRERGWAAMTEAFGPVTSTRNDAEMKRSVDQFMASVNPYTNHHALALFPLFFYIQHSFQNQLTMFYEEGKDQGYNLSVLDRERFWEFAEWAGRSTYNNDGEKDGDRPLGKLYDYKNSSSLSSSQKNKVQELIDGWFGATKPESGKPLWEGYGDKMVEGGGRWANISSSVGPVLIWNPTAREWRWVTPDKVWVPEVESASYAWDRKWGGELKVKVGDWEGSVYTGDGSWSKVFNASPMGAHNRMNVANISGSHPTYTSAQFNGLDYNSVVQGPAFAGNWVVHALGMYLRNGEGRDILSVMERASKKRVASAEFKTDMKDYVERKEELEYEKAREEMIALKAQMRAKADRKKQNASPAAQAKKTNKPAPKPRAASNQDGYMKGTAEYEKAMQKFRQRILRGSAKNKAWLQQMTGQGQKKK